MACLVGCVGTEWVFNLVRKKSNSIVDFSAVINKEAFLNKIIGCQLEHEN